MWSKRQQVVMGEGGGGWERRKQGKGEKCTVVV